MRYLASLASLALIAGTASTQEAEPAPPSVLVLVADDQGWADLSCAGLADDVATPALDRLAAEGTRFTQAYATAPICNAARISLMTGVYPQRFGTFWYGGKGIASETHPTLAERLSARGYACGYVGKVHYGGNVHVPGNRNFPPEHGFDLFFGFSGGRKHYLHHSAEAEAGFRAVKREHERGGQSLRQGPMWDGAQQTDVEGFSTELFGQRARDFLRAHAEEPFLLVLSFNAVHNFTHQLPPAYLEEHGLDGWRDWDPAVEEYYDWYRAGRAPNNPNGRAQYLGQLHHLDREVGRVLDTLDELGLSEETIVVYVGDNGGSTPIYANNGPLRGSKYTLYEGGLRVPLIIRWPGRWAAGAVRDEVVSGLDLFPTLLAATGSPPQEPLDGRDLGPILRGEPGATGHDTLVWDTRHERAVRQGRFKLHVVESRAHADYEMVEVELGTFLHDLEEDPGELHDLAAERPELVEQLTAVHASWRADLAP